MVNPELSDQCAAVTCFQAACLSLLVNPLCSRLNNPCCLATFVVCKKGEDPNLEAAAGRLRNKSKL